MKKTIPDYVKNANDAEIQKFISLEVTETLESLKGEIASSIHKKNSLTENIQNKDKILKLPEPSKISVPDFDSLTNAIDNANAILKTSFDDLKEEAIEDSKVKIPELEKQINDAISVIKASLEKFSESKKQKPYCSIEKVGKKDLIDIISQYQKILQEINDNIEITVKHISTYKDKFRNDTASGELQKLKNIIQEYEKKKARLEQAAKCNEYIEKKESIETLTEEVNTLSSNLDRTPFPEVENV